MQQRRSRPGKPGHRSPDRPSQGPGQRPAKGQGAGQGQGAGPGFASKHKTPFNPLNKPSDRPTGLGRNHPGQRRTDPPPSPQRLAELLKTHGVAQPPAIVEKIWAYHQFMRKHNHDLDLTRLIGFSTIVQRHYADCLILQRWYRNKWPKTLVDIGTGAGFPGLMIKIVAPEVHLILSEGRPRRVDFLNAAIKHLHLKDIEVFGHKFTSKSFTRKVEGSITRAFETVDKTLPRLMNAIPLGGKALFMKGPLGEEEAQKTSLADWKLTQKIAYRIPNTTLDRMLLEYTRIGMTQGQPAAWEEEDTEGTGDSEN
jgi:16S rRNA (guanine527-N7)-methyltransferase